MRLSEKRPVSAIVKGLLRVATSGDSASIAGGQWSGWIEIEVMLRKLRAWWKTSEAVTNVVGGEEQTVEKQTLLGQRGRKTAKR